jgi:hypothetical protein
MHQEAITDLNRSLPFLDGLALSASFLCLIHCLALPLLLAALPALATILRIPESFHLWMLTFAVPASMLAVLQGHRHHHRILPPAIAVAGLLLMAIGVLSARSERLELLLSVSGGLTLAWAHVINWRLRRLASSPRHFPFT